MNWSEVLANPFLQNLPFKIELNRWGLIEMSPASNLHGSCQVEVATELKRKRGGKVLVECSISTANGVRVADVAWISNARYAQFGTETPYPQAPEICVEIMSPSNTWAQMHLKASLYFEAGAKEVWIQPIKGKRTVLYANGC